MYVLRLANSGAVLDTVIAVGAVGVGVVLGVYLIVFVVDSITWHLAIIPLPVTVLWLYRSWKVRMVGEAWNMVLPAGGMGGEPIKAVLMKSHYGLDYRESIASLILARTINLIALVFFLAVGFVFILLRPTLPMSLTAPAGIGLGMFVVVIFGFFAIQRWQIASRVVGWLSQTAVGDRIKAMLHHVEDMDHRLMVFYTQWRTRFVWAVVLAIGAWVLCALETYYAAYFLGSSVDLIDAWIVEAMVQMVRAGTFFIPVSIGVQEGTFLVAFTALGVPAPVAIAVALVKRGQEIAWIVWGGMLGIRHLLPEKCSVH
ncbi:Predicted integral membrane protein [invertebrate metagenome]|uniref:Predicted integral membrane protein n=1 Tax=invertebrate metagenome TaxID=1711999 RepID=A0A484H695_9ZZZZ